jgi:uncharacterized protein YbjT (DUF2867 family)
MKIIIFGATGMVGQGVLRECLLDSRIESVLSIGRSLTNIVHPKLKELNHQDLTNYHGLDAQLTGFDACFFCLGMQSSGKTETEYVRVTYDFTIAAAETLLRLNPQMIFIYVSGEGADSSEKSRTMWARVRGKTENALLRMPFKAVYIFRPGVIQPLNGIQSKTKSYRIFYNLTKPLLPIFRLAFPTLVSTTENIGRAMISVAIHGYEKKILKTADFNKIAKQRNQ